MNNEQQAETQLQYWVVVDAVRLPDCITDLKSFGLIHGSWALFGNSEFQHLIEQSPWVVNIGSDKSQLLSCLSLEGFDSSAVVFELEETQSRDALQSHLHALLLPSIFNNPTFIRFYSPTFWRPIVNELTSRDVLTLLGPSSAVYWMSAEGELQQIQKTKGETSLPKKPYYLNSAIFKSWV
ncbi:DUF4123 domain-containing protein [Vibrio scophthalmi]|uniref:DUF4123 domain-containing protein n=1 Tax=Vibrio scophthalmi TaxID=45658 RepID=A0A1E3WLD9_9VIBR|nr:DUF4123 domain-containing protein [Vibrio scophthalmi]ODS10573.1 hypothetical protein VSF3289_00832 [Vibrio scophthalmi]